MYLTMASLFVGNAMGTPLSATEQVSLLLFMILASKGSAGVTGAGLATLGGGLSSHRPDLLPGVGLIVAVDRFMSEARALTNFSGNAIATLIIAKHVGIRLGGRAGWPSRPACDSGILRVPDPVPVVFVEAVRSAQRGAEVTGTAQALPCSRSSTVSPLFFSPKM